MCISSDKVYCACVCEHKLAPAMATFAVYFGVDLLFVVLLALSLLAVLSLGATLALAKRFNQCLELNGWFWTLLQKIGQVWLRVALRHKFKTSEEKLLMRGFSLPRRVAAIFGLLPFLVASLALIAFWQIFLFDVSDSCDPTDEDASCFFRDNLWSASPLNCSAILEAISRSEASGNRTNSKYTYVCYKVVLRFTVAFAAAGGVYTANTIVMAVTLAIATLFLKSTLGKALLIAVQFVVLLLGVGLLVGLVLFDPQLLSIQSVTLFLVAFVTFFLTLGAPWAFLSKMEQTENEEEEELDILPPLNCCCKHLRGHETDRDLCCSSARHYLCCCCCHGNRRKSSSALSHKLLEVVK